MPSVIKSWPFTTSTEGWTGDISWNIDGLEGEGSSTPSGGEQADVTQWLISPAATWRDWGVPANATAVTGVGIVQGYRKRISHTNLQTWSAEFQIATAGSWPITPVWVTGDGFVFGSFSLPSTGFDSVYVEGAGGSGLVVAPYQAPTTSVQMLFTFEIIGKVSQTVTWDCFFNNVQLKIFYSIPNTFPALTLAP